jgi:hypothetical protein
MNGSTSEINTNPAVANAMYSVAHILIHLYI